MRMFCCCCYHFVPISLILLKTCIPCNSNYNEFIFRLHMHGSCCGGCGCNCIRCCQLHYCWYNHCHSFLLCSLLPTFCRFPHCTIFIINIRIVCSSPRIYSDEITVMWLSCNVEKTLISLENTENGHTNALILHRKPHSIWMLISADFIQIYDA